MITLTPEAEQLLRRIGAQSGKDPEDVLKKMLEAEARLAGVPLVPSGEPRKSIDLARVRAIIRDVSSAPLHDSRSPDEILREAWGADA